MGSYKIKINIGIYDGTGNLADGYKGIIRLSCKEEIKKEI
jgi:hypothetical protein